MDLLTYIADVSVRKRLATAVACNHHYLYQIATDRKRASEALAAAIDNATGGQVACESLRSDVVWERDDLGRVIGYRAPLVPAPSIETATSAA
jgi:DNA-binding transcriptional regulator YdaS (Cro superfamily)